MSEKRFVVSALIDGKEIVRRAVWAADAFEASRADIFTDEEFTTITTAMETCPVDLQIVETG